jgi:mono/diheme cytochrome c family protein
MNGNRENFMKNSLLIAVSLVLVLGLAACDVSLAGDVTPPPGYTMPEVQPTRETVSFSQPEGIDLQAGMDIYAEKCLACHGQTGLGDGEQAEVLGVFVPPIGAVEQGFQESPIEWFAVVHDGRMDLLMPPFSGSLNEQDIWDVLGFVYALGTDEDFLAEGEQLFGETCAACHGAEGEGNATPGAPSLQDAERMTSLSLAEIVQKVATGTGNENHAFASLLDADQQEAAALYVRSLLFGELDFEVEFAAPSDDVVEQPDEVVDGDDADTSGDGIGEDLRDGHVVTGMVVNGSGTSIPEGLEVTLQGYAQFEIEIDLTAPVAADGSFIFEDVPMTAENVYVALVEYMDMFYPSNFYVAEGGDEGVTFEVEIFDSTTDASELVINRIHVFFEWVAPELVQVVHLVSISNLGNETVYSPGEIEPVVSFSLPEGALNLVFESGVIGDPYIGTEQGFGDPRPIAPGEASYEVLFAYEMEYDRELTWTLPIDMATEFIAVFVQGDEVKLESDNLTFEANQMMEDGLYQTLVSDPLSAGDEITLEISGRVSQGTTGGTDGEENNVFVIVAGVLGLALAGYGAWQYLRPAQTEDEFLDQFDADALIDEIIALDEAFEAGEVDEADYRKEREELKAELSDLLAEDE